MKHLTRGLRIGFTVPSEFPEDLPAFVETEGHGGGAWKKSEKAKE